jgi:predicted nucleic acid-binding protein
MTLDINPTMKKKYLLDTCSLISLKKNYADGYERHVAKLSSLNNDDEVCASILSIYELSAGANHAPNIQLENDTRKVIQSIRNEFEILPVPMEEEAIEIFGTLKELYKDWESPILKKRKLGNKAINRQSIDLLIATTAIRNKAILVTSDIMGAVIKEFCSSFRYENWMK